MYRLIGLLLLVGLCPRLWSASWNQSFVPPPGVAGEVTRMVSYSSNLIVGGHFVSASGSAITNIAQWDGAMWQSVAGGVDGRVGALAVVGSNLYVGGMFSRAGDVAVTNFAVWNGHEWGGLPGLSGFDYIWAGEPQVLAILPVTNGLYVAGNFLEAGGVAATNVAFWDGTNWHALGSGIANQGGQVYSLAFFRGQLYAGGIFRDANNVLTFNIARWDGQEWKPLNSGITEGNNDVVISGNSHSGAVHTLAVHRHKLFVGGNFLRAGNRRVSGYAAWTGRRWIRLGKGATGGNQVVNHFEKQGTTLWIGGSFTKFQGRHNTNLATCPLRPLPQIRRGLEAPVTSIVATDHDFFVGGEFGLSKKANDANVVKWDGGQWRALGEGIGNAPLRYPITVAASGSNAFIAGHFSIAGTNRVNGIAQWDGQTWRSLSNGIPGGQFQVSAAHGSNFFVSGIFTMPELGITNLAHWDGVVWRSPGTVFHHGYQVPGDIRSMEYADGQLYIAGNFTTVNGVTASNVARWDGTNWFALGEGLSSPVQPNTFSDTMVFHKGSLYLVSQAPAYPPNSFAPTGAIWQWDGNSWKTIGRKGPYDVQIAGLAAFQNDIYVIGFFEKFNGVTAHNIARWDGTNWSNVGEVPTITDGHLRTITATPNALYLSGYFANFAGVPASGTIKWDGNQWAPLAGGLTARGWIPSPLDSAATDSSFFVVGYFDTADGKPSYQFAEWRE